jgi:hypothetical protein
MDRILEIGEYQIELMDEDLVPVTKSVYDVQDPNQRKSHFTKSIILPSSRVNNQVFSGYFDASMFISSNVQFDPFYNPTKKVKATYYEDSLPVITGYCQLVNINKTKELIEYELIIYGENADFFKSIEGRKLSDLDLSALNHTYTKTNIRNSWTASSGYVYPQIKNGGQTDVYINNVLTPDYWKVGDYDLWFFVKTLWDKIWLDAGFRYYSEFISTETFTKLIYKGDSSGNKRSETDVEQSRISYELATSGLKGDTLNNTLLNAYTNEVLIFNSLIKDTFVPQYNILTGELNVDNSDYYDIHLQLNPILKNITGGSLGAGFPFSLLVALVDSTGLAVMVKTHTHTLTQSLGAGLSNQISVYGELLNVFLDSSKTYKWVFLNQTRYNNPLTAGQSEISINNSRFDIAYSNNYNVGSTIVVNSLLSTEMTQKDFVMGLVKMFNLYIEPYYFRANDPNSGGYLTYLIEPRDDYYTNETIDWTYKIDYNKEFIIKPIGGAKEKFYKFTYDLDKDFHNNNYNQRTGRVFGDVTIDVQNDFLQGTKEVKIPFSLMLLATNTIQEAQQLRPLPTDVQNNDKRDARNDKSKPKILFYNGLTNSDTWLFGDNDKGGNITTESQYPAASHYQTLVDTDCDLCFSPPQELYYTFPNGTIIVTNQGLYNKFHKRGLEEVNNKNSKMLECYVNLTPFDVHNLSLRPIYEIDGNHYRLYEMSDYNGKETTKCTFLKLTPIDAVTKTSSTTRGGRGSGAWGTNPNLWKDTGNLDDRVFGGDLSVKRKVIGGGGILYYPPVQDNLVMLQYRYLSTTTNLILTGGEGSPIYILADTTAGNLTITMPDPDLNTGKLYIVKHINTSHKVIINNFDGTLFEEFSGNNTHEYLMDGGIIIKIR